MPGSESQKYPKDTVSALVGDIMDHAARRRMDPGDTVAAHSRSGPRLPGCAGHPVRCPRDDSGPVQSARQFGRFKPSDHNYRSHARRPDWRIPPWRSTRSSTVTGSAIVLPTALHSTNPAVGKSWNPGNGGKALIHIKTDSGNAPIRQGAENCVVSKKKTRSGEETATTADHTVVGTAVTELRAEQVYLYLFPKPGNPHKRECAATNSSNLTIKQVITKVN
jgi:hypothetical protein